VGLLYEESIGKVVKVVYQDGSNIIVTILRLTDSKEGNIILRKDDNRPLYIRYEHIFKLEEVEG